MAISHHQRQRALQIAGCAGDLEQDLLVIASEAREFFNNIGKTTHARWIDYELNGYGQRPDVAPLNEVLNLSPGTPLVRWVRSYRTQSGVYEDPTNRSRLLSLAHFFVEPLEDIIRLGESAKSLPGQHIILVFEPHPRNPVYPTEVEFSVTVFSRLIEGFRWTLAQELKEADE